MSPVSTSEMASALGIGRATLERWLAKRVIPVPQKIRIGKQEYRLWTDQDLDKIRQYKSANYNKKPRRKKAGRTKRKR